MRNEDLIKSFDADSTINPYRIVKFSSDGAVVQAAAATDFLVGISNSLGATTGERCDVVLEDIAEVEYGGNVTRGALLTSDANGKAVVAAPASGVNNRIVGLAMVSGVSGDIGSVLLERCLIQGQ